MTGGHYSSVESLFYGSHLTSLHRHLTFYQHLIGRYVWPWKSVVNLRYSLDFFVAIMNSGLGYILEV